MEGNEKLKTCDYCGKEIAKNVYVCPHCGGKMKKPIYKRTWFIVLAVLIVLSFIGSFGNDKGKESNSKGATVTQKAEPAITYTKVNIDQLEEELKQNAARAQQNYKGKYIEFSGRLGVIDANGKYFAVDGNGFMSSFHCSIENDKQKHTIINKNKGDGITVRGKVSDVSEILGFRIKTADIK